MEKTGIIALITVRELIQQSQMLKELLQKYKVSKSSEIEDKIKKGVIQEHPAYEDYLSALTLEKNISDLKMQSQRMIEEI